MKIYRSPALFLIAAAAITAGFLTLWLEHARADEQAVLVPINLFLEGLAKRDASAITASAIPGASFVSMQYGTLKQMTFDDQEPSRAGHATGKTSSPSLSVIPSAAEGSAVLPIPNQSQVQPETLAGRVAAGTTHIEERIHHPLVRVDNDLAVVWAPFEFRIDGKLDHCGTDVFSLVRNHGKWLIGSLSATLRKDCQAPPASTE
jgi:hypothetical protein